MSINCGPTDGSLNQGLFQTGAVFLERKHLYTKPLLKARIHAAITCTTHKKRPFAGFQTERGQPFTYISILIYKEDCTSLLF
jgi:hypothetical protein